MERAAIPRIVFEELALFDSFLEAALEVWERSRRDGWTVARYETALRDLATDFAGGAVASTHVETAIVVPQFDAGQRRAQREPELRDLFPYLEQRTRDDDRVRENHQALLGFVARIDHPIWIDETASPHGWRCRCRARRIPFTEAEEAGMRGDFPLGTGELERFRELGGSDPGFPRERFVIP
jgi:hypothetical protein